MRQKNRINKAFYIMTVPMAILFFCFHTFPFLQCVLQLYGLERIWKLEICRIA